ncbi:uncharacterized protein STEHIDRAFT_163183 [Stereum hirsutum FP-91666 SS1]|uniref:Uncharacterized protein n=1 Tax=Stereum hirsutum (strain FP-91666) TaxID=721885 RepID=R7RYN0_STEHR|nr:uncharacterized protein STEHIDRAFT_163183 [Stereum hirsutum FP-91666 SS1]EIM79928.1 hypothetical protein STEHIDRAFT_163183 [Stereum hirsutum FP-91666 SS1]
MSVSHHRDEGLHPSPSLPRTAEDIELAQVNAGSRGELLSRGSAQKPDPILDIVCPIIIALTNSIALLVIYKSPTTGESHRIGLDQGPACPDLVLRESIIVFPSLIQLLAVTPPFMYSAKPLCKNAYFQLVVAVFYALAFASNADQYRVERSQGCSDSGDLLRLGYATMVFSAVMGFILFVRSCFNIWPALRGLLLASGARD